MTAELSDEALYLVKALEQTADLPFDRFYSILVCDGIAKDPLNNALLSMIREFQEIIAGYEAREQIIRYTLARDKRVK